MPKLSDSVGSSACRACACTLVTMRSATAIASAVLAWRSNSTNSSPPWRPGTSLLRSTSCTQRATRRNARSPAAWPRWSLTCLKWSTSKSTSAALPATSAASARVASSLKWRRLGTCVSASILASQRRRRRESRSWRSVRSPISSMAMCAHSSAARAAACARTVSAGTPPSPASSAQPTGTRLLAKSTPPQARKVAPSRPEPPQKSRAAAYRWAASEAAAGPSASGPLSIDHAAPMSTTPPVASAINRSMRAPPGSGRRA